ncbi:MAG: phosphoenolpyruvate--protein phosphotransferase [Brooklawnia sp.]|uniref:phosphoenolpyruvate--protein phosphotransferase n=1 Tax=Brooklawnia sp. TaxID=2699740 RepID=UPI003C77E9DD
MTTAELLRGTGVVAGIAHAPAAWARKPPELVPDERIIPEQEREKEKARFLAAADAVANRYAARASAVTGAASEVLAATAALARDRGWIRAATRQIAAGKPAATATTEAIAGFIAQFEKLGGLMAERATDLKDIRDRVVAEVLGLPEPGVPRPERPIILLATDLAPSDTAGLDSSLVLGLVTQLGGPTSHTAIIARQLGIPCIVAVSGLAQVPDGTPILVDGAAGTIAWGIDEAEARQLVAADEGRRAAIRNWRGPGRLASGEHVQLLANVQDGAGARAASDSPAEGVGLFRTELCFLSAQVEPSVTEQAAIYREVLDAFPGRKVVIRTLDAGSDKPVPFADHAHEENPALGVRGVRLSFARDGLLTRQLDGIAEAVAGQPGDRSYVWVMAPMIATIDEARRFAAEVRARGLFAGVMVEVPSVALLAEAFLGEVDFLSIGTNDLTQYTMAADRMSPDLAALTDPWQPAVLRLIAETAAAGKKLAKPVGVCGEAAADPELACVLVGLGVTSLSMASSAIPAVGVALGGRTLAQCQRAAEKALQAVTAAEAKQAAREVLAAA